MNKKGYIRILEAIFAILLLFGVIIYLTQQTTEKDYSAPSLVESSQRFVLDTISFDTALRYCVIEGISGSGDSYVGPCDVDTGFTLSESELPVTAPTSRIKNYIDEDGVISCGDAIGNFIMGSLPLGHYYTCEICESSLSCLNTDEGAAIPDDGRDVYTKTIFLAISDKVSEKVVRLYYWGCDSGDGAECNL
ncbi:MAG: hypothetical protein ABIB47_06520 [Candidatus Woesearchaeota archaeon]